MTQRLIGQDRHGVGKVETAGILPHGDAQAARGVGLPEGEGEPGGLLAEEEPAAILKLGLMIAPGGLGGGQPELADVVALEHFLQTVIDGEVNHVPIIQAGAFHGAVADIEAQGFYEMQAAAGGGAGAGDVAGIHGDLRLHKHDIEHRTSSSWF